MINLEELQAIKNLLTLKINLENFVNANLFKIFLKKTNANVMISWKK
jgi:pyridoxine 5'-phosphate synthase PdxJ